MICSSGNGLQTPIQTPLPGTAQTPLPGSVQTPLPGLVDQSLYNIPTGPSDFSTPSDVSNGVDAKGGRHTPYMVCDLTMVLTCGVLIIKLVCIKGNIDGLSYSYYIFCQWEMYCRTFDFLLLPFPALCGVNAI